MKFSSQESQVPLRARVEGGGALAARGVCVWGVTGGGASSFQASQATTLTFAQVWCLRSQALPGSVPCAHHRLPRDSELGFGPLVFRDHCYHPPALPPPDLH